MADVAKNKVCKKCSKEFLLTSFSKSGKYYKSHCKKCVAERVGCTYLFFKEYIENKFTDGMDWGAGINGRNPFRPYKTMFKIQSFRF